MQLVALGSSPSPVEFTVTQDIGKQNKVFLFARVFNEDYYVGSCPYLGTISSLLTSSKEIKVENFKLKIGQKTFSAHATKNTDFYRYLSNPTDFENTLIEEAQAGKVHLRKAFFAPYSLSKQDLVMKDLVLAIKKGNKTLVDRAIRIGAFVNQTFFICSGGGIFTSKNAINNHLCEYRSELSENLEITYYSLTRSRELTPLSYAELNNKKEIQSLLSQHGATEKCDHEYVFEKKDPSNYYHDVIFGMIGKSSSRSYIFPSFF